MNRDQLIALVRETSIHHGLLPALMCALVEQESRWQTWAINPEPHYRWLWDFSKKAPFRRVTSEELSSKKPPKDFTAPAGIDRDAEWWSQQISWGLMQLMGAAARERGFVGKFLTELCDPQVNIEYGCLHFKVKLKAAGSDTMQALLLWNGGGNPNYPHEVISRMPRYT